MYELLFHESYTKAESLTILVKFMLKYSSIFFNGDAQVSEAIRLVERIEFQALTSAWVEIKVKDKEASTSFLVEFIVKQFIRFDQVALLLTFVVSTVVVDDSFTTDS